MNKFTGLLLTIFLLPLVAYSGTWSSGGGNAVVCIKKNVIQSAVLLDIYEGQILKGLVYDKKTGSALEQAITISQSIPTDIEAINNLPKLVSQIFKKIQFLPDDVGLAPIDDSHQIIAPKSCSIVQVARFEKNGTLYIDSGIWQKMDSANQGALLVHEALYWYLRMLGAKDSIETRAAVAYAFSTHALESPRSKIPEGASLCQSELGENGLPKALFFTYKKDQGNLTLQFLIFDGQPTLSRSIAEIPTAESKLNETLKESFYSSTLNSQTAAGAVVTIKITPNLTEQTGILGFGSMQPSIPFTCSAL